MAKLIQAKTILKNKGYQAPKFNTDLFMKTVGDYFVQRDLSAVLYIKTRRFVGNETYTDEERTNGFSQKLRYEKKLKRLYDLGADLSRASPNVLIVDEPFAQNASFTLSALCGFIVRKLRKDGEVVYQISLV